MDPDAQAGMAQCAAGKKPKGSVAITATDDLGATDSDSFAVKLKPKKK